MVHGDWSGLMGRELPTWYDDAKLGIFVHWGPYSVPRWAPRVSDIQELLRTRGPRAMMRYNPYSEWYLNTSAVQGSPTWKHHRAVYGDAPYERFADEFTATTADADLDAMAELIEASGAGYAVLTTKHHDGYTLWPSDEVHPVQGRYGSTRDLVGDFDRAIRARGMRTGLYYSGGYDWPWNGAKLSGPADSILAIPTDPAYARYAEAHVRELIERYAPAVLWNDIAWPEATDLPALIADYYAAVPEGVVNDRWAQHDVPDSRARIALARLGGGLVQTLWKLLPEKQRELSFVSMGHVDFTTPEYVSYDEIVEKKWETTRGVGLSFAANRNEKPSDIVSAEELIWLLADTVSKNGNLLIGIGPLPDGTTPEAQQAPLRALGGWLAKNGDAIFATRPWHQAATIAADGTDVRLTRRGGDTYLITDGSPSRSRWQLPELEAVGEVRAELLETGEVLPVSVGVGDLAGAGGAAVGEGSLEIQLPDRLPVSPAHAIRLVGDVRPRTRG